MEQSPFERREREDTGGEEERIHRFQFGPWVFNVNQTQAIIEASPREPRLLPVTQWAQFYGLTSPEGESFSLFTPHPGFDRDYAMTTDLSNPVLVATLRSQEGEEFPLLIDGTHRLYHAHAEQVAELPAYVPTVEETLRVREDGMVGGQLYWLSHDRSRMPGNRPGSGRDGGR